MTVTAFITRTRQHVFDSPLGTTDARHPERANACAPSLPAASAPRGTRPRGSRPLCNEGFVSEQGRRPWGDAAPPRSPLTVFRGRRLCTLPAASAVRCTLRRRPLECVTPAKPSDFRVPEVRPALRSLGADTCRVEPKGASGGPSRGRRVCPPTRLGFLGPGSPGSSRRLPPFEWHPRFS